MTTWLRRTAWALLLVALAIAAVRLALVARPMETSWETIASTSRDAALGWTGWEHTPISNREPAEQAEYWLREVDRILSSHPESAELCMGAAWVLDTPGAGFKVNDLERQNAGLRITGVRQRYLGVSSCDRACSQFEAKCGDRCLELAARATELEPHDVHWWRMRALLSFVEYYSTTMSGKTRSTKWRDVLDECSQRDPDNALYDYLATRALLNESAEVDWGRREHGKSTTRVRIYDQVSFEEGLRRIEVAQKKPFLAIGEAGYSAIAEFLSLSELSKTDQAEVALHRVVTNRQSELFSSMWRWLVDLADDAERRSDKASQIAMVCKRLRLLEQSIAPEETSAMGCNMLYARFIPYTATRLQQVSKSHPTIIKKGEVDQFVAIARADLVEAFVLQEAVNEFDKPYLDRQDAAINSTFIATNAAMLSALSLILAGIFVSITVLLDRRLSQTARLGFMRHGIAWTLGITISFVLFALMPAEIIGREWQTITATIFAWAFVLAIVGFIAWKAIRIGRKRRFQYRIATLLGCMAAVTILAWVWPVLAATVSWFRGLSAEFHVPAKGWYGFGASVLERQPQLAGNKWRWALLQWNAYAGPYLALAFSLVLVALWSLNRQARLADEPALRYWAHLERARWSALFRCLATSALTAGLCALLIYLCLMPTTLRVAESQFQYRMCYCRNPADQIARIHEARDKVLASEEDMEAIREEVELHFTRAQEETAQ